MATDGHRLALAEMPAPEGSAGTPGVIVPRKTMQEARRLLEDAGESVELQISPQKVRFDFGGAALTSKVIDGSFPDYARVIPRDNTTRPDRRQRPVRPGGRPGGHHLGGEVPLGEAGGRAGKIVLTVRNMEAGQAVEELEVDYDGDPFEIGFNARYLLDVTDQISGETAEFRFADPASIRPWCSTPPTPASSTC